MRISTQMGRTFQDFVDALAVGPDRAGLYAAMRNIALAFDLESFAYIVAPARPADGVNLISSYPDAWTSRYLARAYHQHDPVIHQVKEGLDPFEWGHGAAFGSSRAHQSFMEEAASFGIACGFAIPISDAGCRFAALAFASDRLSPALRSCFERQKQVFHLLAILFHARARIALSPATFIGGVRLSRRESECLSWAAKGKSAWEIGRILSVSRRTAAFHLDNAKMKLGVRTIQQAVALFSAAQS